MLMKSGREFIHSRQLFHAENHPASRFKYTRSLASLCFHYAPAFGVKKNYALCHRFRSGGRRLRQGAARSRRECAHAGRRGLDLEPKRAQVVRPLAATKPSEWQPGHIARLKESMIADAENGDPDSVGCHGAGGLPLMADG